MQQEKGTISIHTENIFPIIKKALYSDHEIFLRELVSNAVDAVQKLSRLSSLGEFTGELEEGNVTVAVNKEAKTITVSDNGLGMTADEIKKYINQIAFSGATEFLEKYKDDENKHIIGHFGLGFYSAFMVAKKVDIVSKSYQEGAEAAQWSCDGSTQFEIGPAVKKTVGTDVVLHINDDSEEFLEDYRLRSVLEKYCAYLPVAIFFGDQQINDTAPLWTKAPADLTDEDYIAFYKNLYPAAADPLFWIHLNVDYPFELTGVLYFPKVTRDIAEQKHKIQLYSRQVFITDDVKDVVPEFLTLLHGVIDSPDIPLNVSRSYLQTDSSVRKITGHITKKVADKLGELFKSDREAFQAKWDDLGLFVKYGMVSDDKFYDKAKDFVLLKNTEGDFFTLTEYQEKIKAEQTDKNGKLCYLYATDPDNQHGYLEAAKDNGFDVLLMDGMIDGHFITNLENKLENTTMKRVDSAAADKLVEKEQRMEILLGEEKQQALKDLFESIKGQQKWKVEIQAMKPGAFPVALTEPEFSRRMKDMSRQFGMMGMDMPSEEILVLNGNHPSLDKLADSKDPETAHYLLDLAKLMANKLKGDSLTKFAKKSLEQLG